MRAELWRTIIIAVPPLTFRTYQILPHHTNNYFHSLHSYLDLLPQGPLGYPRGAKPPWYPRSYWRRSR